MFHIVKIRSLQLHPFRIPLFQVEKALQAELVQFMLGLLAGGVEQCDDPSAVKAHGVRLLKKMALDPRCGLSVQARGRAVTVL